MDQHENALKDEIRVEDVENDYGRLTANHYSYFQSSLKFNFYLPYEVAIKFIFFFAKKVVEFVVNEQMV